MPIICDFHFVSLDDQTDGARILYATPAGFETETHSLIEDLYLAVPKNTRGTALIVEARFVPCEAHLSTETYTALYAVGDITGCVAIELEDGRVLPLGDLERDMHLALCLATFETGELFYTASRC